MRLDHSSVRTLLIEDFLQDVGENCNRHCRQQDMAAVSPGLHASVSAAEPPTSGQRAKNMLVGSPTQDLGSRLDVGVGVSRNRIRNFDVGLGWSNPEKRHRSPVLHLEK